jgi:hypothetical protein
MGVGDGVRGDAVAGELPQETLARAGGPGIDEHVADQVTVDHVGRPPTQKVDPRDDLAHA